MDGFHLTCLNQKLSTVELMITMVKLKSITAESAAGADR